MKQGRLRCAREIWQHFKGLPGSSTIASLFAVTGLMRIVAARQPQKILELGSGLGTLTYAILTATLRHYKQEEFSFYTLENEPYCIAALKENLREYAGAYTCLQDIKDVRVHGLLFDLIVVDAGGELPGDMDVIDFSGLLANGGNIFIEGTRAYQRTLIKKWYGDRRRVLLNMRSTKASLRFKGNGIENRGYWLYQFEPTLCQRAYFWSARIYSGLVVAAVRKMYKQRKGGAA